MKINATERQAAAGQGSPIGNVVESIGAVLVLIGLVQVFATGATATVLGGLLVIVIAELVHIRAKLT